MGTAIELPDGSFATSDEVEEPPYTLPGLNGYRRVFWRDPLAARVRWDEQTVPTPGWAQLLHDKLGAIGYEVRIRLTGDAAP